MMGRPSSYTDAIAEDICERVANGQALHRVCDTEGMPGLTTVYRWLEADEAFREKYARAKDRLADKRAEEIITIADEEQDPNRARVRIDARKWAAARLAPKKYGDRVTQEITGKDGGAIETKDVSDMDAARRIAFALAKGLAGTP